MGGAVGGSKAFFSQTASATLLVKVKINKVYKNMPTPRNHFHIQPWWLGGRALAS